MKDFFISYTSNDRSWAEWVAWQLEEAGYSTIIQSWDFHPGSNFVLDMQRAIEGATSTIVILSPAFLTSIYTQSEWSAAFAKDPTGEKASLIPVRVESVKLEGLLSQFVYIDLVGKDEKTAINALLNGIRRERAKPSKLPGFPGDRSRTTTNKPLTFPGAALPPPLELVPFVQRFENDYPEPRHTAFIIMRFGNTIAHKAILNAIRKTLKRYGIEAIRADDKTYADSLMTNVRTLMHGCGFGIAVFERIESDAHNPNVALEVGYMLALGKPICLLKDKSLSGLPTDMVGSLYYEFDVFDPEITIEKAISAWLNLQGIT